MIDIIQLSEDVRKHADIVKIVSSYLTLVKKGKNYVAVCPFHDDTDPSMYVSPEKQLFKCFVCGTGGNCITFVQKYEHITFAQAVKKVAELSDYHPEGLQEFAVKKTVDEKRDSIISCLHDLNSYYQFALKSPEGKDGLAYFESRYLDESLRNKYKLGYAFKDGKSTIDFLIKKGYSIKTIEDTGVAVMLSVSNYTDMNRGRVTFPICDKDGNVVGFSARVLEKTSDSKYMNTPETYVFHKSNILYNYHIAKDAAKLKGYIYVCEGFMDIFALSRIGIDAAVATMGTALTKEHIALLRSLNVEIRLCLDGDLPGQSAMMKIANMFTKEGINFVVVDNQGSDKDPDEILNEDGPEALKEYLNKLTSRIDFALNYYTRMNPLKNTDEKKKLISEFVPILLKITSQLELDNYLRKLSAVTGFDPESIRTLLGKSRISDGDIATVRKTMADFHPERKVLQKLATAERELLYQMLNNEDAVIFYEKEIGAFYDDIYRQIATYLIDYHEKYHSLDVAGLITLIENSDLENKNNILDDLMNITDEDFHPKKCSEELLANLLETINDEKNRINDKDALEDSLKGKDELEKARIISDYNRRKALNLK